MEDEKIVILKEIALKSISFCAVVLFICLANTTMKSASNYSMAITTTASPLVTEKVQDDKTSSKEPSAIEAPQVSASRNIRITPAPDSIMVSEVNKKSDVEVISRTYIRIPKVVTASAVNLSSDYRTSGFTIEFKGMVQDHQIDANMFERVNGYKVFNGKADTKKDSGDLIDKLCISDAKEDDGTYTTDVSFTTTKYYEGEFYETDEAYYVSLIRPNDKYENVVVIDAGHGGMDEGTSVNVGKSPSNCAVATTLMTGSVDDGRYLEKRYTLNVVKKLKKLLDESDIKAYYTRLDDSTVAMSERTELVNKTGADLFVSVHCNASEFGDTTASGSEALYSKKSYKGDITGKKLAYNLLNITDGFTKIQKRDIIQRDNLYVLHHSKVPAAIYEIGYMTNSSDLKYMINEKNQESIAKGLFNSIKKSLN